jgi:hypothetical protein
MNVEVLGTLVVHTQIHYKKPGEQNKNSYWSKLVQLHKVHSIALEDAQEVLKEWKKVNSECVGSWSAALY